MIKKIGWKEGAGILKILPETQWEPRKKIREIIQGIRIANESPGVRCIVITGREGDFLIGDVDKDTKEIYEQIFEENRIPVIVGIIGACSGIGMDLLEKADLAVAAENAALDGYDNAAAAAAASAINETAEPGLLDAVLDQYAQRLLAIPEPLITYGHKIYFAMEKLPDRLSRSRYGASVQNEIMTIQAELNRKLGEKTSGQDSRCLAEEEIVYDHDYDREHSILLEIRDDVEYIQLNTPRYQNMLDWRTSMELAGAYALANSLPQLKAIVVTGTGRRFHLGGIRHDQQDAYEQQRFADQLRIRNQIMREIKVPLISAVNGECSGGGMSLVLKSDLVIVAEHAVFGYPEVKHNGFACNSMVNTMGLIPKKAALKCFYYGDLFSAQEAKAYGIVHQIVPDRELKQAVEEAVRKLSEKGKRKSN